jgi:hypothetical protein
MTAALVFPQWYYNKNGRSQKQGGRNWILPKKINASGNLEKPLMSLFGTEWR